MTQNPAGAHKRNPDRGQKRRGRKEGVRGGRKEGALVSRADKRAKGLLVSDPAPTSFCTAKLKTSQSRIRQRKWI